MDVIEARHECKQWASGAVANQTLANDPMCGEKLKEEYQAASAAALDQAAKWALIALALKVNN